MSFATVFVETLKVTPVNIDPLSIGASHHQIVLNLVRNVLALHDLASFLLPLPQIIVHIPSQNVVRVVQEGEFLSYLSVFGNFVYLIGEEKDAGVPHGQTGLGLDGSQELKQRAAVIDIGNGLILLIVLLLPDYFARHIVKFLGDHLRPLQPIGLNISIGILFNRQSTRTLLQTVIDEPIQFILIATEQQTAVHFLQTAGRGRTPIFLQQRDDFPLDLPVYLTLLHEVEDRLGLLIRVTIQLHSNYYLNICNHQSQPHDLVPSTSPNPQMGGAMDESENGMEQFQQLQLNWCMLSRLPLENQPAEDKAITNLLEIDQREQDLNIWEDRRELFKARTNRRTLSSRRFTPHSPHPTTNPNPTTKPQDPNPPLKPNNPENDPPIPNPTVNPSPKTPKPNKGEDFNEGEYWSSRVNWMSEHKNQPLSQPRLNKKFCFGYEVNGRKSSRNGRGAEGEEKARQDEYKTNLIYSLLHQDEQLSRHARQGNAGMRASFCGFRPTTHETTYKKGSTHGESGDLKQIKHQTVKLSAAAQSSMRQTLRKLYLKNHREETVDQNSQSKQSEQERSTLVRQLLINLENLKEIPQEKEATLAESKQDTAKEPTRSCGKVQKKRGSNVVNLNLQAEKTYKARTLNRWHVKRPSPFVAAH